MNSFEKRKETVWEESGPEFRAHYVLHSELCQRLIELAAKSRESFRRIGNIATSLENGEEIISKMGKSIASSGESNTSKH